MEFDIINFHKALLYFKEALKIAEENHDSTGTVLTLYDIGNILRQ